MSDQTSYSLACRNCGAPLDQDDNFCRNCGTRILKPANAPEAAETPGPESAPTPEPEETARLNRITPEPSESGESGEPASEYEPARPESETPPTDTPSESATGQSPRPPEPSAAPPSEVSRRGVGVERTWWIIGAIIVLLLLACCCIGLAIAGIAASDSAFQQELRSATVLLVQI